jgi:hypothetical protein
MAEGFVDVSNSECGDFRRLAPTDDPDAALARVEAVVGTLRLRLDDLELRDRGPGVSGAALARYRVFVNGEPVKARSLVIRGSVDSPWVVELEYYPDLPTPKPGIEGR